MPCPASPEPDGFHRYQLAPQGDSRPYSTRCAYCDEEKVVRPAASERTIWDRANTERRQRGKFTRAATAAKRREEPA